MPADPQTVQGCGCWASGQAGTNSPGHAGPPAALPAQHQGMEGNSRPPPAIASLAPRVLAAPHTQRDKERHSIMAKIHKFSPEKLCLRRAVPLVPGAVGLSALSTAQPCPQRSTSEGGCWLKGAGNGAGSAQSPTDWLTYSLAYPSPKVWALSGNGLISSVEAPRVQTANAASLASAPSQAPCGCCSACQAQGPE